MNLSVKTGGIYTSCSPHRAPLATKGVLELGGL